MDGFEPSTSNVSDWRSNQVSYTGLVPSAGIEPALCPSCKDGCHTSDTPGFGRHGEIRTPDVRRLSLCRRMHYHSATYLCLVAVQGFEPQPDEPESSVLNRSHYTAMFCTPGRIRTHTLEVRSFLCYSVTPRRLDGSSPRTLTQNPTSVALCDILFTNEPWHSRRDSNPQYLCGTGVKTRRLYQIRPLEHDLCFVPGKGIEPFPRYDKYLAVNHSAHPAWV